jgi:hypothetical protein
MTLRGQYFSLDKFLAVSLGYVTGDSAIITDLMPQLLENDSFCR